MSRLGRGRRQKPYIYHAQAPASLSASPDLINQAGSVFAPSVTHTDASITDLVLINQTGSVFSFTRIDQTVTVGLITQTGTVFSPEANLTISPAVITQTGAVFSPTVVNSQSITPDIITQTGSVFSPVLANTQLVTADLIDVTGSVFTPTVAAVTDVSPDLIDQTGVVYDTSVLQPRSYIAWIQFQVPLAVEQQVLPDTIGNPGVVFAPGIAHQEVQHVELDDLLDYTGSVFSLGYITYGGVHLVSVSEEQLHKVLVQIEPLHEVEIQAQQLHKVTVRVS